jgi:hypothetical protein
MDLWTGIGILLAICALVAPVTPGFQNPWIVSAIWLGVVIYGFFLISTNFEKVASAIATYPKHATFIVGLYAFLAAAGLFHTFLVPKAASRGANKAPQQSTTDSLADVKTALKSVDDVEYRNAVSEVIYALQPKARIVVGGMVLGPDGARTVDIQVSSLAAGQQSTSIDVIRRSDGKPVGIEAIDAIESKRRDVGTTALLCSNTGFTVDAIRKAKRVGVGLIAAMKSGDRRVSRIQAEIYLRIVDVSPFTIIYKGATAKDDQLIKTSIRGVSDLSYTGGSVAGWIQLHAAKLITFNPTLKQVPLSVTFTLKTRRNSLLLMARSC